jgi:hypothetical protein
MKTPLRAARRRRATVRTPALRAHEALGLAVGRLAMAYPEFRDDFTRGFTLAMKEDHVGRPRDRAGALLAAVAAGLELARAHAVKP